MASDTLSVLSTADSPARRHHHPVEHDGPGDMGALEVALMRRSLAGLSHQTERCGSCRRTLLTGERVYEYSSGAIRCALCRDQETPAESHLVHGPEFGHSIRVLDRRKSR